MRDLITTVEDSMTKPTKGLRLNSAEMAKCIGVSLPTLRAWADQEMPVVSRSDAKGVPWQFNSADVDEWVRKRRIAAALKEAQRAADITHDEGKRRKVVAEAELLELELRQKRGNVVRASIVAEAVGGQLTEVRQRLLMIPDALAPLLAASSTIDDCRTLIDAAVRQSLDELSSTNDVEAVECGDA